MNKTLAFVLTLLCAVTVLVAVTTEVEDWSEEAVVVDKPVEHPSHRRGKILVVKVYDKTLAITVSKLVWAEATVGDRIRIVHKKYWLIGTPSSTGVRED